MGTRSLEKGSFSKHYNDIKAIMYGDQSWAEALRKRYLEELLQHAANTTEYYKEYKGTTDLSDFPVVTKKCIKENYDKFLSNAFSSTDLVRVKTSGSYGTPFTFT